MFLYVVIPIALLCGFLEWCGNHPTENDVESQSSK